MRARAFQVPATLRNGFDVVKAGDRTYLRVIDDGQACHAVEQTADDLRRLAALLTEAADLIDRS